MIQHGMGEGARSMPFREPSGWPRGLVSTDGHHRSALSPESVSKALQGRESSINSALWAATCSTSRNHNFKNGASHWRNCLPAVGSTGRRRLQIAFAKAAVCVDQARA